MPEAATSTPSAESHRALSALVWAVAAVVFGVTGWLYGMEPLVFSIGNWRFALDYSEVQAKVVTREGKAPDGTTVNWLAARYDVNGQSYFAERLSVLDDDSPDEAYNSRVLRRLEAAQRRNEMPFPKTRQSESSRMLGLTSSTQDERYFLALSLSFLTSSTRGITII